VLARERLSQNDQRGAGHESRDQRARECDEGGREAFERDPGRGQGGAEDDDADEAERQSGQRMGGGAGLRQGRCNLRIGHGSSHSGAQRPWSSEFPRWLGSFAVMD